MNPLIARVLKTHRSRSDRRNVLHVESSQQQGEMNPSARLVLHFYTPSRIGWSIFFGVSSWQGRAGLLIPSGRAAVPPTLSLFFKYILNLLLLHLFRGLTNLVLRTDHMPKLVDDVHETFPLRHLIEDPLHLLDRLCLSFNGRFSRRVVIDLIGCDNQTDSFFKSSASGRS